MNQTQEAPRAALPAEHYTLSRGDADGDSTIVQCNYCDWSEVHDRPINWPSSPAKGDHRTAAAYKGKRHYECQHAPAGVAAQVRAAEAFRAAAERQA